ncbi:hypothetical protein NC653_029401 [Populus alba x Populus x berolinensis]|uniref:Uncharacterized protein n=1 Tax=Populus alba x Populus x berolinensis TaxID=444605 RepID=A0AAD6Q3E5_9ROSI|nr:hypothetical protein NC653_029401 [Populus alba x Populus x berolinensis]
MHSRPFPKNPNTAAAPGWNFLFPTAASHKHKPNGSHLPLHRLPLTADPNSPITGLLPSQPSPQSSTSFPHFLLFSSQQNRSSHHSRFSPSLPFWAPPPPTISFPLSPLGCGLPFLLLHQRPNQVLPPSETSPSAASSLTVPSTATAKQHREPAVHRSTGHRQLQTGQNPKSQQRRPHSLGLPPQHRSATEPSAYTDRPPAAAYPPPELPNIGHRSRPAAGSVTSRGKQTEKRKG